MTCSGGIYFNSLGSDLSTDGTFGLFFNLQSSTFLNGFLT